MDKASALYGADAAEEVECGHIPDAVLETHINVTKGLLCFSNDQVYNECKVQFFQIMVLKLTSIFVFFVLPV